MSTIAIEHSRRLDLWGELIASGADNIEPATLRSLAVYGGAQGIWVDKERTAALSDDGHGVTVSVLHTGRHYPDDLSDDGVIYHYPTTRRPAGRDAAEIQATKNASDFDLPIFVILPGKDSVNRRSVRLGWVVDFDDESRQFLILFGTEKPIYRRPVEEESPFELVSSTPARQTTTKVRRGQQRFRFQVLAQYGCKCAVCTITHLSLIKAAHIRGKAHNGSDDWRNGLPLCSTHHDAFDAHLFAINPDTLEIDTMPGITPDAIGITTAILAVLHHKPHVEALIWRIGETRGAWVRHGAPKNPSPHHLKTEAASLPQPLVPRALLT
jgi:hypothetical protein